MTYQESPAYTPPPAAPPEKKGPPKALLIGGGVLACICVACVGVVAFGAIIGQIEARAYADGHAAYLAGDCATAIQKYDSLSGEDLKATAQPELDQCGYLQNGKSQVDAGNYSSAL